MHDLFSLSTAAMSDIKLNISRIQYLDSIRQSWRELFSGFDSLKAITYSSSIRFMHTVIDLFDDVEIIFGNEMMIGRALHEIIAYQDITLKNIREYVLSDGAALLKRIDEGTLRLFVAKEQLSHEKLYILQRDSGLPRTILGSANFSYSAFSGGQREHISIEETVAGYEAYLEVYCQLREQATNTIHKEQVLLANAQAGIEKMPVFESVKDGANIVVLPEDNIDLVRFGYEVQERAKKLRPLMSDRVQGLPLVLKTKDISLIKHTIIDNTKKLEQRKVVHPQLILDSYEKKAMLNGAILELNPSDEEVRYDIELFIEYMEGFNSFHGKTKEMKERYYEFANWFFVSPFMPLMRKLADTYNRTLTPYPTYGLVYGQSKAGKTSFLATLLIMMIGTRVKLSGSAFTKVKIETLKRESSGAPIIIDDMMQKRFSDYAIEAIKNDDFGLYEDLPHYPAVVISANEDVKAVDKQVLRRTVTCHVQAGLTTMESIKSQLVNLVQRKIKTALYRRYIQIMFSRLPELVEQFKCEDAQSFPDILAVSSDVLYGIFKEFVGENAYHFIRKLSVDDYFNEQVAGAGVIARISNDWRMRPKLFSIDKRSSRLIYNAEATYEADRLLKQLPENLVATKSGSSVSMDLTEAFAFFKLEARGLFSSMRKG
jgi:hypothetical protein